ncbi:MAG: type I-E CRISPR-associated protein Cas6/Cse3/CasE [Advenella sp.]|nr:type I-E CRISPR-associated protein Cas6/Cse3/CasE [Advenella sp.]
MSLIASVLHLDRHAVSELRINDVYSLHKAVYSLFPDIRSPEAKCHSVPSGFLYADKGGSYHQRKILLLSNRKPKERVHEKYGYVQSKELNQNYLLHSHYRFEVIVNPTRRDSASRKLVPVKGREAIALWFAERAEQSWGFKVSLPHLQIGTINVEQFKDKNKHCITLAQAHITGRLEVIDQQRFVQSFASGIGRGRAFGCGLLQIVPVVENPFA